MLFICQEIVELLCQANMGTKFLNSDTFQIINSPASSLLLLRNIRFLSKLGIIGNYSTKCKSSLNTAKSRQSRRSDF